MKMQKREIESKLTRLLDVLNTNAKDYARYLNNGLEAEGRTYRMEESDTYPYRIGVAISVISNILGKEVEL